MNDAIQQLIDIGTPATGAISPTSRYFRVGTNMLQLPGGKSIVYLRRRFVPPADRFTSLLEYTVVDGDRLDNLAAQFLGDPQQFWRLCDANGALRPEQLEIVGRRIVIALPEGVPGTPNA